MSLETRLAGCVILIPDLIFAVTLSVVSKQLKLLQAVERLFYPTGMPGASTDLRLLQRAGLITPAGPA